MAFVPAPNIIQVEFRCLRNGQQVENRVMVNALTAPTPAILEDVAIEAWNWWENLHAPVLPADVNLREVVTTDMSVQNGAQFTYAPDTTTVGGLGGFALPNEVSLCVSLRSGVRGRSARGRWFMLGLTDAVITGTNSVTPAHASNCAASLNALRTAIEGLGYVIVIVSYITNLEPRPGGPVYFVVTNALVVDNVVDSQRRRKPGIGS